MAGVMPVAVPAARLYRRPRPPRPFPNAVAYQLQARIAHNRKSGLVPDGIVRGVPMRVGDAAQMVRSPPVAPMRMALSHKPARPPPPPPFTSHTTSLAEHVRAISKSDIEALTRPKKPATPLGLFVAARRAELLYTGRSVISSADVIAACREEWRALEATARQPYEQRARHERKRYEAAKAAGAATPALGKLMGSRSAPALSR